MTSISASFLSDDHKTADSAYKLPLRRLGDTGERDLVTERDENASRFLQIGLEGSALARTFTWKSSIFHRFTIHSKLENPYPVHSSRPVLAVNASMWAC